MFEAKCNGDKLPTSLSPVISHKKLALRPNFQPEILAKILVNLSMIKYPKNCRNSFFLSQSAIDNQNLYVLEFIVIGAIILELSRMLSLFRTFSILIDLHSEHISIITLTDSKISQDVTPHHGTIPKGFSESEAASSFHSVY